MMIILLLLLLPALGLAASPIDWNECATNMCYCEKASTSTTDLMYINMLTEKPEICTTVGIQNKFFTADIALFQVNVIGSEADKEKLGDEPKLMFFDGTTPTFGCKQNKETGKAELFTGKEDYVSEYKLSLFEDRSHFKPGEVVCAVLMELAFNFKPNANKQTLKLNFKNDKDYTIELGAPEGKRFFKKHMSSDDVIRCNPLSFKDLSLSSDFHVKPIINRDSDKLNCENYNNKEPGISYKMKYFVDNDPKSKDMKELVCKKDANSEWGYNLDTGTESTPGTPDDPVRIPNPEAYTFYCAVPFNEMCTKPACNGDPDCPEFNKNGKTVGQPPTLECTGNKWVLDGKFYQLSAQPVCQLDPDDADNGSAFFATLPGEDAEQHKITAADRCFTEYDCTVKSFLDMPTSSDEQSGGGIDKADATNVLRCVNKSRELRVTLSRDNLLLNDTSYVCNKQTGEWYNDTTIVPEGASVSCLDTYVDRPEDEAAELSQNDIITYIVVVFVVGVLVLAGCTGFIYVLKIKILDRPMSQSDLIKMNRSELIKTANSQFPKIIIARPVSKALLIYGLEIIKSMVRSETYDTDSWAKAYLFLIRLQTVVSKLDTGIYHMVNRYLFLQAKKIIDNRGWLAETPVMPLSSEELMRVVAIRLLVFPLLDCQNESDAEQLLCEGFRKLGWRGGSQYPHAGVLWSVIGHARPQAYEEGTSVGEKAAFWKRDHFLERLYEIAAGKYEIKMLDQMVRPEFGTAREQAAFALGGAAKSSRKNPFVFDDMCKTKYPKVVDKHGKEVPGSHKDPSDLLAVTNPEIPFATFTGMCEPVEQNAVEMIILTTKSAKGRNQAALNMFWKIRPDAEWQAYLKKAQTFVAYCGAVPDAQKLHACFGPVGADYTEELSKMQDDQNEFEAAVDAALGDLRKWLAENTDKDEFKQEPVYLENTGANKVDDVIPDQANVAKPLGASCDGSESASKTEQASDGPPGSNKSSSDEAAPAAAAATPTTPDAAAAATPTAPPVPDAAAPAAAPAKP